MGWLVGFVYGVVCWKKNGKYISWHRVVGDDGHDFTPNVGLVCLCLVCTGLVWLGLARNSWLYLFY